MTPDYAAILKRTGTVLVVVGVIDIGLMIYCILHGISYSSSFNIFAVVAGLFLMRRSLRAASIVRWFSVFLLAGVTVAAIAGPAFQPWDLTVTTARLYPGGFAATLLLQLFGMALLFWVQRQLGSAPVLAARVAAARRIRDMRIPAALGGGIVLALFVLMPMFLGGESGKRAVSMAEAQLGPDFKYHVTSLNVSKSVNGQTFVSAVVVAWNQQEIRNIPLKWRE